MILVNGIATDTIPVDDRGLAYGDGLFETLDVHERTLPLLDYHLERLDAGLRTLRFPVIETAVLREELLKAAEAQANGIVKLVVTRGSGSRGYAALPDAIARRIVRTMPAPAYVRAWREEGVRLRYCATLLEGPSILAGLKHLNRLPQVLARSEWSDVKIHEGLMRDVAGRLIEGTMSNVFAVIDGSVITPPVGAGVRGVMRRLVLECAQALGIPSQERFLADAELESADELFITNCVIGICPVIGLESRGYGIGTITRRLQRAVADEIERRK